MRLDELFTAANVTRWTKRGDEISKQRSDRYGLRQHRKIVTSAKGSK